MRNTGVLSAWEYPLYFSFLPLKNASSQKIYWIFSLKNYVVKNSHIL